MNEFEAGSVVTGLFSVSTPRVRWRRFSVQDNFRLNKDTPSLAAVYQDQLFAFDFDASNLSNDSFQHCIFMDEGFFSLDAINPLLEVPFVEAIMSCLERHLARFAVLRCKNSFLFTPSFLGSPEDYARIYQSSDRVPLISATPMISFVGPSLLVQIKLNRGEDYRLLDARDLESEARIDVLLLPTGTEAQIYASSISAHSSNQSAVEELIDSDSSFIKPAQIPKIPALIPVHIVNNNQSVSILYPSNLVIARIKRTSNYLNSYRDIRWSEDVQMLFDSIPSQVSPVSGTPGSAAQPIPSNFFDAVNSTNASMTTDYWKFVNPTHRLLDLTLTDAGQLDHIIRTKEAADAKAAAAVLKKETERPASIAGGIKLGAPKAAGSTASEPKQDKNTITSKPHGIKPNIPSVTQSMSAPVISPLHTSNTGSDLDLAMLGAGNSGSSNNNSKELMDLELGQIGDDDFDDFFGGGPSTTVKSTSVTGSIGAGTPAASGVNSWGSIGSTLNAASPPLPIACSPAAFTPGITTSGALSPEVPYTPNHHSTPHPHPIPSFVPESATPGKTATASISAETPSQIQVETMPNTPAPTTSITHHDSLMASPKFIPESLVIIYPTSDAKADSASLSDETELVPQQWQAMQMDFKAVWGDRGTRYGTVYKYVLADTANDQTASHLEGSTNGFRRKRALNEMRDSPEGPMRKHARFEKDESDSDDDSGSSESEDEDEMMKGPNEEDEEVLEDGEVMAGGGGGGHATAAAAATSSVAASFSVDRESELTSALALQLMVEGMTVGRGSTCFSDGIVRTHGNSVETSVSTRRKENSLKPVFAHRILQFLSSTLTQVFAGSALGATDSVLIRGPLTLEQVFDYNDTIDPKTPKYGKYQLRKKKRLDPILELLPLPNLRAEHNDIPISMNPTALRVWDKLGLSPAAGSKDVEYLILAPAGTRSFVSHLRRWTTELSNLWDFSNFGSMSPCLQLQGKFSDEDGVVQAKLRQVKSDTRDDSRMRAYAETVEALAPELSRIVYYHTKSTKAPYTALFLLNPLPHKPQSSSELHLIVSRLLVNVSDMTKVPLQTILEYIIPVVLPIQFAVMPRMTEAPCLLKLKEFIFGLYSRCRGRSRPDTDEAVSLGFTAHACFVSKSLPSPGVGLMMRRPLDAPTCTVSDPDRIVHVVYKMGASVSSSAGVCWSDSYGELVDCAVVAVDKSASRWFLKFLAEVWERTVTLLRLRKIAAGVTWRLVIAREGLLSNLELHDFETFSSYVSAVNSPDTAVQSVTSLSFVSLNTDSSLTVIDPGAVNGIPGGGASQYFLAGNLTDPVTDKKVGAHAELDQIRKKINSHERIIPDDDASYIFLMRSQRLPISKVTEVSDPSFPARTEKDSQKPDSFLPLANGYLVNVPRRESNLPSEAGSTMSSVPLPPPEGSPASQTVEISLLHHVNMPTQPKATCYPGWLPISPASKTENVGQYSSPAASISTPTSSFSVVSNTNTPVLAHTHIEKSPGTINPTTPQPSTPFSGGIGGGGGGGGSGVLVGAPQQHHVNILRDIMREYHGLKYAHRGPSIQGVVGEAGARVVPWIFEMAEISERVGDEFHTSV